MRLFKNPKMLNILKNQMIYVKVKKKAKRDVILNSI